MKSEEEIKKIVENNIEKATDYLNEFVMEGIVNVLRHFIIVDHTITNLVKQKVEVLL